LRIRTSEVFETEAVPIRKKVLKKIENPLEGNVVIFRTLSS
jgi:hypothetical protein